MVEGEGVRAAVRPVGGTNVTAQIDDNGQVIYRQAYAETDSLHVVSAGRSEEFLFLQNECAPREFEYELSELSAGTRVELVNGEVRFTNEAGHGVKIEAPWLIEATGERPHGSGALGACAEQKRCTPRIAAGGGARAALSSADRSKLGHHRQSRRRT